MPRWLGRLVNLTLACLFAAGISPVGGQVPVADTAGMPSDFRFRAGSTGRCNTS